MRQVRPNCFAVIRRRLSVFALAALPFVMCGCAWFGADGKPKKNPLAIAPMQTTRKPTPSSELPPKQTAEACLATAEQLEQNGHYREAILLYEKARRNNPRLIDFPRRLAALYDREGNAARAQAEYQTALKDSPNNADLLNDFGFHQFGQGDLEAAEETFRAALRAAPEHKRAKTNLAVLLAWQSRYQESFEAFASVVGPAAAHSNVGAVMAKQGRTGEAMQAFRQSLALDPSLQQPKALLAYLESQQSGAFQARAAGPSTAGPSVAGPSAVQPASFTAP